MMDGRDIQYTVFTLFGNGEMPGEYDPRFSRKTEGSCCTKGPEVVLLKEREGSG
jgi:hypothetical protein